MFRIFANQFRFNCQEDGGRSKIIILPYEVSPKGSISEFEFDIWNFYERWIWDNITLNQMYEATKMYLSSYYLSTCGKGTKENAVKSKKKR